MSSEQFGKQVQKEVTFGDVGVTSQQMILKAQNLDEMRQEAKEQMEVKADQTGIKFLGIPVCRHLVEQEKPTNKIKEE